MSEQFYWVAVAALIIMSSARLTRLATWDHLPPIQHLRDRYADWCDKRDSTRGYALLAFCGYCASFWLTAMVVLLGWWVGVFDGPYAQGGIDASAWFLGTGIFGGSYVAAIVMAHDGDDGDEDDD